MRLRDKIGMKEDCATVTVDVPEWDARILFTSMTGDERTAWELSCTVKKKGKVTTDPYRIKSSLIIVTARDPLTKELCFTDDDATWLRGRNAAVLERLFAATALLSGITAQDEDELAGK